MSWFGSGSGQLEVYHKRVVDIDMPGENGASLEQLAYKHVVEICKTNCQFRASQFLSQSPILKTNRKANQSQS